MRSYSELTNYEEINLEENTVEFFKYPYIKIIISPRHSIYIPYNNFRGLTPQKIIKQIDRSYEVESEKD